MGDHVDIFLKTIERLNPNLQRRTAHTLKEMTSIAQIETAEAKDGIRLEDGAEAAVLDKDSREDRTESLQLEELERMLDRDGVIRDGEDKVSDDDGTAWAADAL